MSYGLTIAVITLFDAAFIAYLLTPISRRAPVYQTKTSHVYVNGCEVFGADARAARRELDETSASLDAAMREIRSRIHIA